MLEERRSLNVIVWFSVLLQTSFISFEISSSISSSHGNAWGAERLVRICVPHVLLTFLCFPSNTALCAVAKVLEDKLANHHAESVRPSVLMRKKIIGIRDIPAAILDFSLFHSPLKEIC